MFWPTVPAPAAEAPGPAELKAEADRWIAIEQRIAAEKNQWRADKEVLQASLEVLRKEQATLRERAAANDLAATAFASRLGLSQGELAAQETGHGALMAGCDELERRLRALHPQLPEPLQEKVAVHLARLGRGAAEEPTGIAERTQALVAALSAIDQFNNGLTLTHHLRQDAATGQTLDIKVLYWGLARGYAIDGSGQRAWMLVPRAAGWEWQEATAQAAAIKALVEIYEKQKTPELVTLPIGAPGGAQ